MPSTRYVPGWYWDDTTGGYEPPDVWAPHNQKPDTTPIKTTVSTGGNTVWNQPTNSYIAPAYGATSTLPGANGEYVPPGSPTARTNGAIDAAGATPAMTSPLTGKAGVTSTATGDVTGDPASPLPAAVSPSLAPAEAVSPDVTPGVTPSTGPSPDQILQILSAIFGSTGGVAPTAQSAGVAPQTTAVTNATAPASGINLPGLPSNGQNLQGLLIAQELNKASGVNPYSDLQPYAMSALNTAFGPVDTSPEYLAYQRGENMLKSSEAEQQRATLEDMNRRGILTSGITIDQLQRGIAGGQLARQNLLSDLLTQRAAAQPAQQAAALQNAASVYGLGTGANQQSFQNLAALMQAQQGLQGQEFGQQQQVYQQNLENYLKQITLQNELNKSARAEQMQAYNALMQLAGLGGDPMSGLSAALQGALSGQAQENSSGGEFWGALGSALPSLLALL